MRGVSPLNTQYRSAETWGVEYRNTTALSAYLHAKYTVKLTKKTLPSLFVKTTLKLTSTIDIVKIESYDVNDLVLLYYY